ncbi:MAG: hypothetical protein WAP03_26830 [Methylorubrum rhodinum]|uniref:hypothetical protein n=1 Tax=Methylorubrum rhodinum TaxID=29428 RepID=UPI003BB09225
MAAKEQKNRRYRNAKISEHRLRRVVECFARDMTAAETVKATRLSAPTVNLIFHRLRERMRDHGLFVPKFDDGEPHPLAVVFNPKHRGVPEHLHDLHAIERIHRILCAQHLKGFERLLVSDPNNVERATRLLRSESRKSTKRYQVWELFKQDDGYMNTPNTKLFNPNDIRVDSFIIINELHTNPQDAFFAYLWKGTYIRA